MKNKLKDWLRNWLGIEAIDRKVKEHNHDIVAVMDEQLQLRKQYPLEDTIVVPTNEQITQMNEGGPDGQSHLQGVGEDRGENAGGDGEGGERQPSGEASH